MAPLTPMMQQYVDTKKQYKDCILLYRLGDFYEMFFEDALIASKVLEITLTGKDCGQEERAPMCGIPYHAVDGYLNKLIEKGYKAAIQAMPVKSDSTFAEHWLFSQGNRRGLFFGVLSRCFFRVYLTIDETLDDKFELTKFIIDNPERFRNLTWRSSSSQKHIVHGIIKAEKDIVEKYGELVKNSMYSEIAKYVSLYCSVRLVDVITEQDIYDNVYKYMETQLLKKED